MADIKHVVTGLVRLSYVHLDKPYKSRAADQDAEPKYGVTVLIPKSDIAAKQRIDAAIEAATQQGAAEKWNGRPAKVPNPVYDGDGPRPSDSEEFGPECKGHWVLTANSKQQPGVVDANMSPIINPTEIYSGMYGRVSLDFYAYARAGKKGVGVGLCHVQKLRDGEPLGGRTTPDEDFSEPLPQGYGAPAPAYTAPAQPAYTPPTPPQGYGYPGHPYAQPMAAPANPAAQALPYGIDPITGQPMAAYGAQ